MLVELGVNSISYVTIHVEKKCVLNTFLRFFTFNVKFKFKGEFVSLSNCGLQDTPKNTLASI